VFIRVSAVFLIQGQWEKNIYVSSPFNTHSYGEDSMFCSFYINVFIFIDKAMATRWSSEFIVAEHRDLQV
jgi:hypothetical protein